MDIFDIYHQLETLKCEIKSLQLINTDLIYITAYCLTYMLLQPLRTKQVFTKYLSQNETEHILHFDKTQAQALQTFTPCFFIAVNYLILMKRFAFNNLKIAHPVLGTALKTKDL